MAHLGHDLRGNGPEGVIVLHEFLGDHRNYDPVLPYLDGAAFTYALADFRGYGRSKDLAGAYTLAEVVADVRDLAASLGWTRYHVVGHSMSGMVAQRLALDAGEAVKSMVLIAPVPASGFKADAAQKTALLSLLDADETAFAGIAARTGNRYDPAWIAFKVAMARSASTPEARRGYLEMFTGNDFADAARGLKTPLLVVLGAHDAPFYRPDSLTPIYRDLYPHAEIAVCGDAGHYPMLETPPLLISLVQGFLRRQA